MTIKGAGGIGIRFFFSCETRAICIALIMHTKPRRIAAAIRSGDQGDLVPLEDEDPVTELVGEASDVYAPTQAQLVRAIGMQPLALTQWRGGKRRPSPDSLRKMARELLRQSDELRRLSLRLELLAAQEAKRRRRKKLRPSRGVGSASPSPRPSQEPAPTARDRPPAPPRATLQNTGARPAQRAAHA